MTTSDRRESTLRIGLLLPDVMGTYGDDGNALVLRQRARMRGFDAEIVRITLEDDVPDSCDVYTLGGGEDSAQRLARRHLAGTPALRRALDRGAPLFAVCAGLQILGEWFVVSDGEHVPGLGVIDATTSPRADRAIGELRSTPLMAGLTQPLTGFENHRGATTLGPDAAPLGRVARGVGNGDWIGADGHADEGVVQGSVIATYMHGPALARNPELADLLLARAMGVESLVPLEIPVVERLRRERLD